MPTTTNLLLKAITLSTPLSGPIGVNVLYNSGVGWITAATGVTVTPQPGNPTVAVFPTSPPLVVTMDVNTNYTVLVQEATCDQIIYEETFYFPCANTCPPNFTLSADGTYCSTTWILPATPPSGGVPQASVQVQVATYSVCGSYIFEPGFNVNGTGPATQIDPTNSFWVNGSGGCGSTGTTDAGPGNRTALWVPNPQNNQTVGFSQCFTVDTDTTYYVGCMADNMMQINIDGNSLVNQDTAALDAQFGTAMGVSAFEVWFIYPVILTAGTHVIEMIGVNGYLPPPELNPAAIGCEIYNNTAAEIAEATGYGDLSVLFSTKNVFGQPIQIGNQGTGYQCPTGYSLSSCLSPVACVKYVQVPPTC